MAAMVIAALRRPYCFAPYISMTDGRRFWGGTQGAWGPRCGVCSSNTSGAEASQSFSPRVCLG